MTNKAKKVVAIVAGIICIIASFTLGFFARYLTLDSDLRNAYILLEKYNQHYYFDDGDIVTDIENALLDKYSTFYTKEEYDSVKRSAKGESEGVGIAVVSNTTTIAYVVGNSPCDNAGVKAGGSIVAILDGAEYKQVTKFSDFTSVITKTQVGGIVTFKVDYSGTVIEYSVPKQKYVTSYVIYQDSDSCYSYGDSNGSMERTLKQDFCTITGESVAYIKYSAFSGTKSGLDGSNGQLTDALNIFKEKNKSKLILDLRGNGGGYMSILCQVASNFINVEDGKTALVAVAVDKNGNKENFVSKKSVYNSYGFEKIVVMCDEGTASASEALIGAMLDYDVNNIVSVVVSSSTLNGQTVYKSYGKGIMQSTFVNPGGSAVKLTSACIFWPVSNTTIHNKGITTNVSNKVVNAQRETALETALSLMN